MGSMAMAIGDIPREWYKVAKKSPTPDLKEDNTATTTTNETASVSTQGLNSSLQSLSSDSASTLGQDSTNDSKLQAQSNLHPESSSSGSKARPPLSSTSSGHKRESSQGNFNLEAAIGAGMETGKGVQRIVETSVKTPMNFCMGLAKGFRNVPRLYNDDTVRKQEKVTGLTSGLMLAGKEFGFGLYDGITGLVTQPYKGAEKEGARGLIKGFGKGIGGLILKPQAGECMHCEVTLGGMNLILTLA